MDGTTAGGAGGTVSIGGQGGTAAGAGGANAGSGGVPMGGTAATDAGGSAGVGAGGSAGGGAGGSAGESPTSGCGSPPPASDRYDIDVDGMTREYILRVPDGYESSRAYPLIFVWHPWGGSAQQAAGNGSGGYHGLVGEAGDAAILVSPEGLDVGGNGLGWANEGRQDEAFMRAMHARFGTELCVDENRVFSTGFSFGGMMSFALGCGAADLVRAIAPQAGSLISGCPDGDLPVALMGFHGVNDSVVGVETGRAGRDVILERNGCSGETTMVEPSWCDEIGSNNQPCTCVSYQGCAAGYPVTWCEFNADHTPAPSAGPTLWEFFSQF